MSLRGDPHAGIGLVTSLLGTTESASARRQLYESLVELLESVGDSVMAALVNEKLVEFAPRDSAALFHAARKQSAAGLSVLSAANYRAGNTPSC